MPDALSRALSHLFARTAGGIVIAAGLAVFLALISYAPSDISLNAASGQRPENILGFWGSVFADLVWQTLGAPGLLISFVLAGWGWRIGSGRGIDLFWGRCFAALIAILASGIAIAALYPQASLDETHLWSGAIAKTVISPVRGMLPSVWGGRIIATGMTLLSLGALYMAAALTFEEWHALAGTLKSLIHKIGHAIAAMAWNAWVALRYGRESDEGDDLFEEEDGDEDDTEEKSAPSPQKARERPSFKTIVRKPSKTTHQPRLPISSSEDYTSPPVDFLQWPDPKEKNQEELSSSALEKNAKRLEAVLADFGVSGTITRVSPGPVVTLYELEPSPGTRSSRVISLADDIARNMSATSVRVAVVQGRNVIGIELPNKKRETVFLRELICSEAYTDNRDFLPLILGKDIAGEPVITDLSRMPHLLIAGTTGSGKSVAINTMILSLLFRLSPQKCRFIMIDPKVLELSIYEGIPHLLAPVVTEPKKAIVALKWATREMEERYRAMAKLGVRNIEGYNIRLREAIKNNETLTRTVQTGFDKETGKPIYEEQPLDLTPLPYIVIIVDEMADLMIVAGKDIESSIQRLAQKARAAGLHLIMATQRPSVDVITGTIKANFPNRVSFQVTSKIDSRTILGEQGAEQLLGRGDMLYMAGGSRVMRVHGPLVGDTEVEAIVTFLKEQGDPEYRDDVTKEEEEPSEGGFEGGDSGDEMYDKAVDVVLRERKASISFVQRHLKIGYNRAATLIERMEKEGLIGSADHVGRREVLGRPMSGEEEVE